MIRIGCSGWQYRHWRGDFYPAELPQARWFGHYALTFDTVEINNSFYRLPEAETFARWREQAPRHFLYAVKASRFLTHMKKLKDPEEPLFRFFDRARHLGRHLGPVLYQLPPNWPLNLERFEHFLAALHHVRADLPAPANVGADLPASAEASAGKKVGPYGKGKAGAHPIRLRHAVEFREPTWYDDRVFDLLQRHGVALCLHDMHGSATGKLVIGPFIYVRFHFGTAKYGGRYEDEGLDEWATWLAERSRQGLDIFAYFNNDVGGHAPRDAVRLRRKIEEVS